MSHHNLPPQKEEARYGKRMIFAAWLLGFGLLTLLFNDILERQHNPNSRAETLASTERGNEVILKRNRFGHYVAEGLINGVPVTFLLDTGATDVVISPELARRLKLERGPPQTSYTANAKATSWPTRLESVTLGNIRLENIRASILSGMEDGGVLLGMSYLKQLEIIQRGNTMILRRTDLR